MKELRALLILNKLLLDYEYVDDEDRDSILFAIEELEALQAPKTCETCVYFFQRFTEDGYLKYNKCDNDVNCCYDKFGCTYHKPKAQQ